MSKTDHELGKKVSDHLRGWDVETPFNPNYQNYKSDSVDLEYVEKQFSSVLQACGLNLENDSLKDTPTRVAKMYVKEIFKGLDYRNFPRCMTVENKMRANEMILIKNIGVWSVCEHHLVPFTGVAHIGYVPKMSLMGLSKFNRVVDFFSRRPQVQERLTLQIYHALQYILGVDDIAVVITAVHNCVRLRGVRDHASETTTSKMGGLFMDKPAARQEFLALIER